MMLMTKKKGDYFSGAYTTTYTNKKTQTYTNFTGQSSLVWRLFLSVNKNHKPTNQQTNKQAPNPNPGKHTHTHTHTPSETVLLYSTKQ